MLQQLFYRLSYSLLVFGETSNVRFIYLIGQFIRFIFYKSIVKSERRNDVLFQTIEKLGGIYVKIAQFICLQTELFSNEEKMRFLSFYDRAPVYHLNLEKILIQELGEGKFKRLSILDTKPFASGAFAQVYKAVLDGSTSVIIKVKRPHLLFTLKIDFIIFHIVVAIYNLLYYQTLVNLSKLVKEFQETTERELDYLQEVKNAEYFYHMYQYHPIVTIPKTFAMLCTNTVIVQEYIEGLSLTDIIRLKNNHVDYRNLLLQKYGTDVVFFIKSLPYELALQGLLQDKFYADPHPGNIIILPNNRYAFIDFGILGTAPRNKRTYYNIVNLIRLPTDELNLSSLSREFLKFGSLHFYKCLRTIDGYFGADAVSLTTMITESYNRILEDNKEKFKKIEIEEQENFTKMYLQIITLGKRFNITIPEGLLATIRSVSIYKSYTEFLEPNLHPMREVYDHILHDVDIHQLVNYDDAELSDVPIEIAIETVLDWVHQIAETDPSLFFKISQSLKHRIYA